ncbi:MAG: 4a-hydroxytetrahydrobiopterin dehydratase [Nanoarchaeota archaeon]|nr:4a-hydroxytetrahydrobiopterin dehydratase [Nanoarchaeota archaeon]
MTHLNQKKCIPCQGGVPPLKWEELQQLLHQVNDWKLIKEHHIEKTFEFNSYKEGLEFTMKLGNLAEENGHHPIILLDFKKVTVTFFTHKIDGLQESDFIMAAKTDQL